MSQYVAILSNRKFALFFCVIFGIWLLVIRRGFWATEFIYSDDMNLFVLNMNVKEAFFAEYPRVIYRLLQSVSLLRIMNIAITCIAVYFYIYYLKKIYQKYLISLFIVFIPFSTPYFIEPIIQLSATHYLHTLVLFLCITTYFYYKVLHKNITKFDILLIFFSYIFICIAHPVFRLVAVIPFFILLLDIRNRKIWIICTLVLFFCILYMLESGLYHYQNIPGLMNLTVYDLVLQIINDGAFAWKNMHFSSRIIFLIMILMIFGDFIFFAHHYDKNKYRLAFVMFMSFIVVSIPIIAIKTISYRYLFMNGTIFLTSIIMLIASKNKIHKIFYVVIVTVFVVFSINQRQAISKYFGPSSGLQKELQEMILHESPKWNTGDTQLIIMYNALPSAFTSGYNHWTTGLLRHLSHNQKLIAISGTPRLLYVDPVVGRWRVHGEEYSGYIGKNGKRVWRIPFKGIELFTERKTYTYIQGEHGQIKPVRSVCIAYIDAAYRAEYGGLFHPYPPGVCNSNIDGIIFTPNAMAPRP